jgi:hypothetical protein
MRDCVRRVEIVFSFRAFLSIDRAIRLQASGSDCNVLAKFLMSSRETNVANGHHFGAIASENLFISCMGVEWRGRIRNAG